MPIPDIDQYPAGSHLTSKLTDQYRDQGNVVIPVTEEPTVAIERFLDSPRFHEGIRIAIGCDLERSTCLSFISESWQNRLLISSLARDCAIGWIGNPRDLKDVLVGVFARKCSPEWRTEFRNKAQQQRSGKDN